MYRYLKTEKAYKKLRKKILPTLVGFIENITDVDANTPDVIFPYRDAIESIVRYEYWNEVSPTTREIATKILRRKGAFTNDDLPVYLVWRRKKLLWDLFEEDYWDRTPRCLGGVINRFG